MDVLGLCAINSDIEITVPPHVPLPPIASPVRAIILFSGSFGRDPREARVSAVHSGVCR